MVLFLTSDSMLLKQNKLPVNIILNTRLSILNLILENIIFPLIPRGVIPQPSMHNSLVDAIVCVLVCDVRYIKEL